MGKHWVERIEQNFGNHCISVENVLGKLPEGRLLKQVSGDLLQMREEERIDPGMEGMEES